MFGGDVPDRDSLFALVHHGQHSVIGGYEHVLFGSDQDRAPLAAHSRIHHHDVDGVGRKVAIRLGDGEGAVEHVEGLHGVADVHQADVRIHVEDDALHGAHVMIVQSEIGG